MNLRISASLVLLLVVPGLASAATYYVSPSGSGSNSGTSPDAPWTLSKANSSLVAGDVCLLQPGTYSTLIEPQNSGTGPTARITYVGSIGNPDLVTVGGITIDREWITVKGVNATGALRLEYPARFDSVAWSKVRNMHFWGAKNCMVARNTINGTVAFMLDAGQSLSGTANAEFDTLRGNIIDLGNVIPSHNFKIRGYTQNCLIDSNRVTATYVSGSGDGIARIFYNSSNNTLRDNWWRFEALAAFPNGGEPWNGFVLRDSSRNYVFERDTLLMGISSSHRIRGMLAGAGTFTNSVGGNRWTQCIYKTNSYIFNQDRFSDSVIEHSVFASSGGNALWFLGEFVNSRLEHSLIWSPRQAMKFDAEFIGVADIRSNIFYSQGANGPSNGGGIVQYGNPAQTGFTADYNVFYTPTSDSNPGDRSINWCCYFTSVPGAGEAWHNKTGQEGNSRHGSPEFLDPTFAGLNPVLLPGSAAIGAGAGGSNAGPTLGSSGGGNGDTTPPATITDLTASQPTNTSLLLSWTAPGDDGIQGRVLSYDLRWSLQPISPSNFTSAMRAVTAPQPVDGGSPQQYVMTGLNKNTTYYFAFKSVDDGGNWSGMSNMAIGTTANIDTDPPAAITDLGAPSDEAGP